MDSNKKFDGWTYLPIIIASLLIIGIVILYDRYFAFTHFKAPSLFDIGEWGTIGDFVGGLLNPAFSFIALMVLLRTMRMQSTTLDITRQQLDYAKDALHITTELAKQQLEHSEKALHLANKQLEYSIEELKLSREELASSAKALEEQSETLKLQQFENTFFQLLKLFANRQGKSSFTKLFSVLEEAFKAMQKEYKENPQYKASNLLPSSYKKFIGLLEKDHYFPWAYFRLMHSILALIDSECAYSKTKYVNILCSQLSEPELYIIFYDALNSFEDDGRPDFKTLIIKYAILRGVKQSKLLTWEHKDLYPPEAYGELPIEAQEKPS